MKSMTIDKLINMNMGESIDWLINNRHDYQLVSVESIDDSQELISSQKEQIKSMREALISADEWLATVDGYDEAELCVIVCNVLTETSNA